MAIKTENTAAARQADAFASGQELKRKLPVQSLSRDQLVRDITVSKISDVGGGVATPNVAYALTILPTRVGCVQRVVKAWIQVNAACTVLIRSNIDNNAVYLHSLDATAYFKSFEWDFFNATNQPFEVTLNGWMLPEGSNIQVWITTATSTKPKVDVRFQSEIYSANQDFDSDNVCIIDGDSIANEGAMGNDAGGKPYLKASHFTGRMQQFFRDNGKRCNIQNRAVANTTVNGGWFLMDKMGVFDLIKAKLLIIAFGMNDAETARGVTTTIYENTIVEKIKWAKSVNPNIEIIVIAPSPTDSTSRVANIAAYRTAAQNAANNATYGTTARGVYFYNAGTSFTLNPTASADTNFLSTERSDGNRIHPSGLGQALYWDNPTNGGLKAVIQQTKFYLEA